eukprot:TRINITY_DN32452_c0_g1_i1.p1 TRINITY_DN32452_c0_g1~~TRINITY_DN32452_c0_g1_i1.p1  ORF type:complete len:573 (+),score=209.09 TRINITY_DN32452_c0_g1_i1:59-1720(+)
MQRVVGKIKRSFSAGGLPRGKDRKVNQVLGARLIQAVQDKDIDKVQSLLGNPECDPSFEDVKGRTPLHYAAEMGDLAIVKILSSQQDIDVNAADANFATAFMEAQAHGHTEVADYLKAQGAFDSEKFIKKSGPELQHHNRGRRSGSIPPKSPRRRGATDDPEDEGMETGDVVDHTVLKKIALAVAMPFIVLLLMQGSWFFVWFVGLSTAWFALVMAFLVTELSIRPPWYHPHPGTSELSNKGIPPYWQGIYTNPKYDFDLDYDEVEFESDSYTLRGWWIPNSGAEKCLIFVHGGGRDRRAWLRHIEMFHKQSGYACLLFDFREHGASDGAGRGFTYGVCESRDVRSAARYVRKQFDMKRVVVVGTSVGGSSVILAAAGCPDIDCVVSENPVSHASALQDHHLGVAVQTYLGSTPAIDYMMAGFAKIAAFILRVRIGYFSNEAIDVITLLEQPIFLMHGTGDEVVPVHHAEDLFASATQPKELWLAPDAFHCGLYNRYPEEFQKRVLGFLSKHMEGDGGSNRSIGLAVGATAGGGGGGGGGESPGLVADGVGCE